MPQIICKGIAPDTVQEMSEKIAPALSALNATPVEDYFFFSENALCFQKGAPATLYPLIEIQQFERAPEQEQKTAALLCAFLQEKGYADVEVYYIHLARKDYYGKYGDDALISYGG